MGVTRNTKFALVEQDARGTLKAPSSNTDFLSAQADLSIEDTFETLENAELSGTTMNSAPALGPETVTGSFSHYIRHSGTEGAAPQALNVALKNLWGNEAVAGSELTLGVGSTTTVLKYADTSSLQAGEALLIKDNTNGWSLRTIESVDSGTDVTLSFALANAPASGVTTGKAVLYYPAASDSDYKYLSAWDYRGGDTAIQASEDTRVTEGTITAAVNDYLQGSFSLQGLKMYYDVIETTASAYQLQFTDDDLTDEVISLSQQSWVTPHALASAIETAMNGTATTETHSVSYSDTTGKFTFENTTGSTLELDWNNGANSIATLIGFDDSADDTGATTYTSDDAITLSTTYSATSVDPLVCRDHEVLIGDGTQTACTREVNSVTFTLTNTSEPQPSICSSTGRAAIAVTGKAATVELDVTLDKYDADLMAKMRNNTTVSFLYNFGTKDSNGFEAGKSGCLYVKYAKVTTHTVGDRDGTVNAIITLTAFSSSGNDSVFMNFV